MVEPYSGRAQAPTAHFPRPSLAEFILARIAEEEERARKAGGVEWFADYLDGVKTGDGARWILDSNPSLVSYEMTTEANARHAEAWSPARTLLECEAKRGIVEEHAPVDYSPLGMESPNACSLCGANLELSDWDWVSDSFPCRTLRLLALPYADHPDYREEWKP